MRRPITLLVATLAAVASCFAVGPADAKAAGPKAELVAKHVTVALSSGKLAVSAKVKNKGTVMAKKTQTAFTLSKDGKVSADDTTLGRVATPAIGAKAAKTVSDSFTVPASLAVGTYHAIACVDARDKVDERKEGNDCKASKGTVTISQVTVTWSESTNSPNGTVTATATGGSCSAPGETGTCTVFAGASHVTLTAGAAPSNPADPILFTGWTAGPSGPCAGAPTTQNPLTITNPTANQHCVANYDFTS